MGSTANLVPLDKSPQRYTATEVADLFDEALAKYILANDINGSKLLSTHVDDLVETLNTSKDQIQHLLRVRTELRKKDFETREKLNMANVKSFVWDQVCQMFEDRVTPSTNAQRHTWFSYIEKESIDGQAFCLMKTEDLIAELHMTQGQKVKFRKLKTEIGRQYSARNAPPSLDLTNGSRAGVVINGDKGHHNFSGTINVF